MKTGNDNGLDRERVDVVVDDVDKMLARDVPTPGHNQGQEINKTNTQSTTATTTRTRIDNCNANGNGNHKMGQSRPLQPFRDAHHSTIGQQGSNETICCRKQQHIQDHSMYLLTTL